MNLHNYKFLYREIKFISKLRFKICYSLRIISYIIIVTISTSISSAKSSSSSSSSYYVYTSLYVVIVIVIIIIILALALVTGAEQYLSLKKIIRFYWILHYIHKISNLIII